MKLNHYETVKLGDATLCDVYVVCCYVMQPHRSNIFFSLSTYVEKSQMSFSCVARQFNPAVADPIFLPNLYDWILKVRKKFVFC